MSADAFRTRRAWLTRAAAAAVVLALAGCMHPGPHDSARTGPFFTPANVAAEPSLGGMRRVVLLPVWMGDLAPRESAIALDRTLQSALQPLGRFEVVVFDRAECRRRFGAEAFSSASALPHGFLETVRREYAADGVLFVDVTVYEAYRPLSLGLRAKLATADGARLVWTFDNVFSAADPAVANAARNHRLGVDRSGVPADFTRSVLQSPSRFADYAATAMFATLPPVVGPVLAANATEPRILP